MQNGSLTLGDALLNYGKRFYETLLTYDCPKWTTNNSCLFMECVDNTEIAVHRNSSVKVLSLLWYVGWVTKNTILGRNMEWGSCSNEMQGATTVNSSLNISGKATFGQKLTPISNSVFCYYNNR